MGYILTPIAVEFREIATALGSKDVQLVDDIEESLEGFCQQFDEVAADVTEDGEPALTVIMALKQMVMGERYDEDLGFVYAFALELLCRYFGELLPNDYWFAMPSGMRCVEEADRALSAANVPADVFRVGDHLIFRGAPIAIPNFCDFGEIGYLKLDEIKAAQKALEQANLGSINDQEVLASIKETQSWLKTCVGSGRDLITFYG